MIVYEVLPTWITSRKLNGKDYHQLKKAVQMFLTGRDKQGHLFDNPIKSDEAGSKKGVRDDAQTIRMLWDSIKSHIMDLLPAWTQVKTWEYLKLIEFEKTIDV